MSEPVNETNTPIVEALPRKSFWRLFLGKSRQGNNEENKGISRRSFLKLGGMGVAGMVNPGVDKFFPAKNEVEKGEASEILKPAEKTIFVDIDSNYNNQVMLQNLLGDLYLPPDVLDPESTEVKSKISTLLETDDDRVVATLLAYEMLKSRKGHGDTMVQKYMETLGELNYSSDNPTILPLQEAFTGVEFDRDELGNPFIVLNVDGDKIGDILEGHFNQNPNTECVNLSLQIGKTKIKQVIRQVVPLKKTNEFEIYDEDTETEFFTVATDIHSWAVAPNGKFWPHRMIDNVLIPLEEEEVLTEQEYQLRNESHRKNVISDFQSGNSTPYIKKVFKTETIEMYNPEFAEENLKKLIALCKRFPTKSFNVSGGNLNSFFYEARKKLEEENLWPENLLVLAGEPEKCDGADIYLESYKFDEIGPFSSSESAARITALDSLLASQGLALNDRRSKIETFCKPIKFKTVTDVSRSALSLEPSLYKEELTIESKED